MENQELKKYVDLLRYKHQIILQGPPGTGKTREAKRIAKALLGLSKSDSLENNEQFKLIQFHPSYSYEDFVRGIVVKNTEGNISYITENKVLAEFAKKASMDKFMYSIYQYMTYLENGKEPILFKGGQAIFDKIGAKKSICLKSTKQNYPYEYNITQMYNRCKEKYYFFENYKEYRVNGFLDAVAVECIQKFPPKERNYVLIIDEINRANLSAVFGELIYALEYRGKAVESIYAVEGDHTLILPPNLYIIGTMNTADRSVGHIDYAIRRRFAFVNILPENLSEDKGEQFASVLFEQVSELFDQNLSPEFRKEDVQLGHSYFLTEQTPIEIRLKYEIKPILLEYVKDGVLIGEDIEEKIAALTID